jgi:hypothetical protein
MSTMTHQPRDIATTARPLDPAKFRDPDRTALGAPRASVVLGTLETLWINTGTLCNVTCANCYIESSPGNDRLAYFNLADAVALYDEIAELGLGTAEIGFTGGEPFMNPDLPAMLAAALDRGFSVLVLTNAMRPMQRPRVLRELLALKQRHGRRLRLRVSLDHYGPELHERERGPDTWAPAVAGLDWLVANGTAVSVAGRTCWDEPMPAARAGYAALFEARGWPIDAADPASLVLFPEMDARVDVPEITTACWDILHKSPADIMCASSRMVVRRKGADRPAVMPCTLIAYDEAFEMGATLAESLGADGGNFEAGAVKLNHPHCARFCVLGGGSCSTGDHK